MRFIFSLVKNFRVDYEEPNSGQVTSYPFLKETSYELISYVDSGVDSLSLYSLNRELRNLEINVPSIYRGDNAPLREWHLPPLSNNDYETLSNFGYAIVRRLNDNLFNFVWVIVFDIFHEKNAKLRSMIRDVKLSSLV